MHYTPRPPARQDGFTLVEFMVVIAMLGILLAIVLLAINPARQFAESRDTKRRSDLNAILNGIHGYMADNSDGAAPSAIPYTIADGGPGPQVVSSSGVDICSDLIPRYLAAMPKDPGGRVGPAGTYVDCTNYNTRYTVERTTVVNGGRVTVYAPQTELVSPPINETR